MRLIEFQGHSSRQPEAVAAALQSQLGKLVRVGGGKRHYTVGDSDQVAAVYLIDGTVRAFALAWSQSMKAVGVQTVYVWTQFDINEEPNFAVDLPTTGEITQMIPAIGHFILHPATGQLSESVITEARRSNDAEFMKFAQETFPDKANKLTMADLMAVASKYDVQIPTSIRMNQNLKVDAHHWNLSGAETQTGDLQSLSKDMGAPVEAPDDTIDPAYNNMVMLGKAKTVRQLAGKGRLELYGRKPNGAFMKIPGFEEYAAQMERMLERQLNDMGGTNRPGMEQQYEDLKEKVSLVAGGQSAFIKSLLITGAPSSGKSFSVMQTIKGLGLQEGKDYVVKKGRITTVSMYRTLIEQVNGMVIFDDCDSVVEDKNAVNMLKGALDTDPVREISYDVRGTVNTSVMDPAYRDEVVNAMSRILRGRPTAEDLTLIEIWMKRASTSSSSEDDDFDYGPDGEDEGLDPERVHAASAWVAKHLPNKIDFRGRIIFISNMDESEWDSAILTRAFAINMNFSSGEMLDYIDKIKGHLRTPNLTDEQKQEVMDYLRELYTTGKLKRQINFRLVQQAFDLRLASNWKRLVGML